MQLLEQFKKEQEEDVMEEVELTQEEFASIERLMNLGFNKGAATEAFLSCNRDENIAAN